MLNNVKFFSQKRKSTHASNENATKINNCVTVNNKNDYKVISDNYIILYCSILTKQEIIQSMKK